MHHDNNNKGNECEKIEDEGIDNNSAHEILESKRIIHELEWTKCYKR